MSPCCFHFLDVSLFAYTGVQTRIEPICFMTKFQNNKMLSSQVKVVVVRSQIDTLEREELQEIEEIETRQAFEYGAHHWKKVTIKSGTSADELKQYLMTDLTNQLRLERESTGSVTLNGSDSQTQAAPCEKIEDGGPKSPHVILKSLTPLREKASSDGKSL